MSGAKDMTTTGDHDLALATELNPPPAPVRKDKKWRRHPRPNALTKRGPPRPYRRLEVEVLDTRISKLTARLDRAKKQHEEARTLLIRYTHERFYRTQEAVLAASAPPPPDVPALEAVEPTAPPAVEPVAAPAAPAVEPVAAPAAPA